LILLAVYAILILIISSVGAEVIPKRCEESCNHFLWQQHLETPLQGACVLVLLLGALLVYAIDVDKDGENTIFFRLWHRWVNRSAAPAQLAHSTVHLDLSDASVFKAVLLEFSIKIAFVTFVILTPTMLSVAVPL